MECHFITIEWLQRRRRHPRLARLLQPRLVPAKVALLWVHREVLGSLGSLGLEDPRRVQQQVAVVHPAQCSQPWITSSRHPSAKTSLKGWDASEVLVATSPTVSTSWEVKTKNCRTTMCIACDNSNKTSKGTLIATTRQSCALSGRRRSLASTVQIARTLTGSKNWGIRTHPWTKTKSSPTRQLAWPWLMQWCYSHRRRWVEPSLTNFPNTNNPHQHNQHRHKQRPSRSIQAAHIWIWILWCYRLSCSRLLLVVHNSNRIKYCLPKT